MLIGSIYFNKLSVIKVGLVLCCLFMIIFGLNWLIAIGIFGTINDAVPFNHVTIPAGKEEGSIFLPSGIANIFEYGLLCIFPSILWLLSFTRLREKEF
jgi:hypothetical protein